MIVSLLLAVKTNYCLHRPGWSMLMIIMFSGEAQRKKAQKGEKG